MYTQGRPYRRKDGIPHGFDAIVIGSGMGGLGVASVLAQQGMRMLVLEQNAVIGGLTQSYDRAGYRWTVGMHYIGDVASPRTLTWKMFDYAAHAGTGGDDRPLPRVRPPHDPRGDRRADLGSGTDRGTLRQLGRLRHRTRPQFLRHACHAGQALYERRQLPPWRRPGWTGCATA